jgi:hypothetical protein
MTGINYMQKVEMTLLINTERTGDTTYNIQLKTQLPDKQWTIIKESEAMDDLDKEQT